MGDQNSKTVSIFRAADSLPSDVEDATHAIWEFAWNEALDDGQATNIRRVTIDWIGMTVQYEVGVGNERTPGGLSGQCADALADLAFIHLPSCDPDQVASFIGAIHLITEQEVRRAVEAERERLLTPGRN